MVEPFEEYQRLTQRYRELGDEELLDLARQVDDLTEPAQQVLRTEISARQLTSSSDDAGGPISEKNTPLSELDRFGLLSAADCVWEFGEDEDAQVAGEMLKDAGIECDVVLPSVERFDMGAPRVAVLPGDVEKAREMLSQPIPEEFRILVRTRDQFVPPTCPQCGSADPLLESIQPTNKWQCEVCGNIWLDTLPS